MKRLHVHVTVRDLSESIQFYSTMFGVDPDVTESDYAKWMLDDPRVNFAISERCGKTPGIDHLGIQVDEDSELTEIAERLQRAERPIVEQKSADCCYAISDKAWAADPQGVTWETFRTFGNTTVYGEDQIDRAALTDAATGDACCARPAVPGD